MKRHPICNTDFTKFIEKEMEQKSIINNIQIVKNVEIYPPIIITKDKSSECQINIGDAENFENCQVSQESYSQSNLLSETNQINDLFKTKKVDFGCQFISEDNEKPYETLVCNRFIYGNSSYSDVETQTSITIGKCIISVVGKKFKNKSCGTITKIFVDQAVGSSSDVHVSNVCVGFHGITSINSDREMLDMVGISLNNFEFLYRKMKNLNKDNYKIQQKDRLSIFLMILKTELSFTALSVLFCVDRTTVSRIFHT